MTGGCADAENLFVPVGTNIPKNLTATRTDGCPTGTGATTYSGGRSLVAGRTSRFPLGGGGGMEDAGSGPGGGFQTTEFLVGEGGEQVGYTGPVRVAGLRPGFR